jgi:hypothetical protein
MTNNPLIIGATQRAALNALRDLAAANPVDMPKIIETLKTPEGKAAHMRQMDSQTIDLPLAYMVTYSVEIGHPCGPCRHMSLSSQIKGRTPIPEAVWMVCQELGFVGDEPFTGCWVYPEELQRGPDPKRDRARAMNIVQPLNVVSVPPGGFFGDTEERTPN